MSEIIGVSPEYGAGPLFAGLSGDVSVSFEFFPPKNDAAAGQLYATINTLASCAPAFVSVTYGAGVELALEVVEIGIRARRVGVDFGVGRH